MAFPQSPLDLRAELNLAGTWTDVSHYAMQRDGVQSPVAINRGRPDETSRATPGGANVELNNRDGRFSPKNPLGAYYGQLGRNTPMRLSVPAQANYLRLEVPGGGAIASTPDVAALHITGSIEMRIAVQLTDWQGALLGIRAAAWEWYIQPNGALVFFWLDGGSVFRTATSTLPVPFTRQPFALRFTLDATTGNATFYTAATIDGTYTQLGAVVNPTAGATSIAAASGSALQIGWGSSLSATQHAQLCGRVAEFRLYSGIGGSVVADTVMSGVTAGATTWTDSAGLAWSVAGGAEISSRDYRWHGETSSLPPRWDPTGADIAVQVTSGGLLRRLGQGNAPIQSPMRRAIALQSGTFTPVAYWPCEDSAGASSFGSATGGPLMAINGSPTLASDSGFPGSAPLPKLNGASFFGRVPTYSSNGAIIVRALVHPGSSGVAGAPIIQVTTTGTCAALSVLYESSTNLEFTGTAGSTTVFNSGSVNYGVSLPGGTIQQPLWMSMELTSGGGSTVNWALFLMPLGSTTGVQFTGSFSGTIGNVSAVYVNPSAVLTDWGMGHFSVQSAYVNLTSLTQPFNGWAGEPAGQRFARVLGENGLAARVLGSAAVTAPMGVQPVDTLSNVLQQCEGADRGMIYEPRQVLGLAYRTLASMLDQSPAVTLDYSQAELGGTGTGLEPTYDDQYVRNDETVTRGSSGSSSTQGATFQFQLNDGSAMSISQPPAGIGDYANSDTINCQLDSQVPHLASWIVHVGSQDVARWPAIPVNLARNAIQNNSLYYPLLSLDVGDYLQVINMLGAITADPVNVIVSGTKESLGGFHHEVAYNCAPESPYEVIVLDDLVRGRVDTDKSSLASAATSAATTLQVATASGFPAWTQAAGDFPFDVNVGGERCTVTAIGAGAKPNTRTGVYMDQTNFQQNDWNGLNTLWHSWTGQNAPAVRYYAGNNLNTYTTNLQEIVAAGARICLSFTPAYNPPSASDRNSITSLLATLQAAGADVRVTVHHEPFFTGLSASQYVAAVQFYAPAMRAYYPFWCVFSGNDAIESNGYYPGDSYVDGIACDVYLTGGFNFSNNSLVNAQSMADNHAKPLGIWEMNTTTGTNFFTGDNQSFAVGIGNWAAGSNCGAPFHSTVVNPFGVQTGALGFSATALGNYSVTSAAAANWATQMQACSSGDEITVGAWVQAGTTGRVCNVAATFFTSTGTFISTLASADASATATDAAGTWTSIMGKITAPATAARYAATIQVASAAAGETHRLGMAYASDSTTQGHTQGGSTTWWQWAQGIMTSRLAAKKANGDILLFNAGMPGNSNANAIQFAADYRIPLWQAIVSALDSTGGPQTMTVTRSVNGVVKAQAAGTDVRLWTPPILSII